MKQSFLTFTAIVVLMTLSCSMKALTNSSKYSYHSKVYIQNYLTYLLDPNETLVKAWYHYLITKSSSGQYIVRTFYPESKQITSEIRYQSTKLLVKSGEATKWSENGNLLSKGFYQNNASHGHWKEYHRSTGLLSSEGEYVNGLKGNVVGL